MTDRGRFFLTSVLLASFFLLCGGQARAFLCLAGSHGFESTTYDFGSVPVGSTGDLTTNVYYWGACQGSGSTTATITTTGAFSASPASFTIADYAHVAVTLHFQPTDQGNYAGTATVTYADGRPTETASVAGVG